MTKKLLIFLALSPYVIHSMNQEERDRALFNAISSQDLTKVKQQVEAGADVNCCDSNPESGFTALQWSCCKDSFEIAQYLITNGANVNTKDNNYLTPLHYACWTDLFGLWKIRLKTVQLLLENGADIYVKSYKDHTPLDIAKCDKRNDPITQLLIAEDQKRKEKLLSLNKPRLISFVTKNPNSFSCPALAILQRK